MPSFFHHLVPLTPPPNATERQEITCLQQIPFETKAGYLLQVAILGRKNTVDAIVLSIPTDSPENLRSKWIEQSTNHMLAVLRLTYDQQADVIREGDGFISLCYEDDNPIPGYPVLIKLWVRDQHIIDPMNIARTFCATYTRERAPIAALLAEAQMPSIPTHYKILSLIRALELLVTDSRRRTEAVDAYNKEFQAIGISGRRFPSALHELRTRCAHGVSRGSAEPLVAPLFSEEVKLTQVLYLLRKIVIDMIGDSFGAKLLLGPAPPQ